MSISPPDSNPQPDETKPTSGAGAESPPASEPAKPAQPARPSTSPSGPFWRQAGWAVLTIALVLLMLDASAETFLRGAPVRWIVLGVAAGAVLLTGLVHRRLGWDAAAATSLLTFLALLALTAWLPGGSERGVVLLRQPTPVVLAGTCGLALLLAAGIFAATRILPLPARAALALLAVYGAAAFIQGAMQLVPFAGLFHGQSLWTRLPWWLQGAFVGGMVVLPLALIAHVAPALVRPRRLGQAAVAAVAWGMVVVMASSGLRSQEGAAQVPARTGVPSLLPLPSGAELRTGQAVKLEAPPPPNRAALDPAALADRTRTAAMVIPETRYSIEARAKALGDGIGPAFTFVRDQIRFEAYPGVLRGAEGAYNARAGNSLDRSLLLGDLLTRKGFKVRYAIGRLDRQAAERLYARIFETPPAEPRSVASSQAPAATDSFEAFRARIWARARRDYAAVRAALGSGLPKLSGDPREGAIADLTQHVWVQAESNGTWVDLDSSFADATPGKTPARAERVVDAIPQELHQRVTMRVVVESLSGGALSRETLLEMTQPVPALLGQHIFFGHAAVTGTLKGIVPALKGEDGWLPVLWIHGQVTQGKAFAFQKGDPGIASLFGGESPVPVAEWFEVETIFPDGRRDLTRKPLFDRATEEWRAASSHDPAALRPLPQNNHGAVAPQWLHNVWFTAGPHDLTDYASALHLLLRSIHPAGAASQPELTFNDLAWILAIKNFPLLVWTEHLVVPAVNDSPDHRLYADSPRVFFVSLGPDPGRPDGSPLVEYDLRRDTLRGLARDRSGEQGLVERKIWYGVLQGALEHEIIAQDAVAAGVAPSDVRTTSSLLAADGAVAIRPADAGHLEALGFNPAATSLLRTVVAKNIAVVPASVRRGGPVGWWEIDGTTGDTRAVLGPARSGGGTLPLSGPGSPGGATIGGGGFGGAPTEMAPPRIQGPPPPAGRGAGMEYTAVLVLVSFTTAFTFGVLGQIIGDIVQMAARTFADYIKGH